MSNGSNEGTMLFAFLAGAIIGVGVGLLVAPKAGSETRRQLADLAHKAQDKAGELKERVSQTFREAPVADQTDTASA